LQIPVPGLTARVEHVEAAARDDFWEEAPIMPERHWGQLSPQDGRGIPIRHAMNEDRVARVQYSVAYGYQVPKTSLPSWTATVSPPAGSASHVNPSQANVPKFPDAISLPLYEAKARISGKYGPPEGRPVLRGGPSSRLL
jgi:hypothetical protein